MTGRAVIAIVIAAAGLLGLSGADIVALPTAVRALLAVPLVLFLPGYVLLRGFVRPGMSGLEFAVLAFGLSVATTIIGGLVLDALGALSPTGWMLYLCSLTVFVTATAYLRGHRDFSLGMVHARPPALGLPGAMMIATAVMLVMCTVLVARQGVIDTRPFAFTQFWLVPRGAATHGIYTLGIENQEGMAARYDVDILLNGTLMQTWNGILLRNGESRTREVAVPPGQADARRLEAFLFRDGDRGRVYRRVWIADPSGRMRPSNVAFGSIREPSDSPTDSDR